MARGYAIFDSHGKEIRYFDGAHRIADAFGEVGILRGGVVNRDYFPVTVEALSDSDVFTIIARVTWEGGNRDV